MWIANIPGRLRRTSALVFFLVPISALEVMLYRRADIYRLPVESLRIWLTAVSLMVIPIAYWLNRGRKWALDLLVGILVFWVVASGWLAFRRENPSLGFFGVFLAAFGLLLWTLLKRELARPSLSSGSLWYQGHPQPIPGVEAMIQVGGAQEAVRLGRFDGEEAFVFHESRPGFFKASYSKQSFSLELVFAEKRVVASGRFIAISQDGRSAGLALEVDKIKDRKELGDLFEQLKGKGYVY